MITPNNKTIGICETQPVTAEGLRAILAQCPEFNVLPAAQTLLAATEIVVRQSPAIMLVDKAYGTQNVLDWIAKLKDSKLHTVSIVWGTSITEAEALRFLQSGARGILRKTAEADSMVSCIRAVAGGNTWMEDSVFRETARPDRYPRSELTAREQQVLELVERGLKNKEIGQTLGIRPGTVKIHLKHIFEKTGVRGRYGLALSGLKDKGVINMLTM